MNGPDARAYCLSVLRKRMAHPRFDRADFCRSIEGAGGPNEPGWMVRAGWMFSPGNRIDGTRFRLTDLFAEIDHAQEELFT